MTAAFVLDASATIGWVHPGQATTATQDMLHAVRDGATIHVPALWFLEVANALLVLTRRGKLAKEERQTALQWLDALPVTVDHEAATRAFGRLCELAETHTLSVHDATYLELASRYRLVLACKDGPLRRAACACGVRVW